MSGHQIPLPALQAGTELPVDRDFPQAATGDEAMASKTTTRNWLEIVKWVFSFPAMMGAALVGFAFYGGRAFFVDPDVWWHIKVGQDLFATHHFPTTDPYSWSVHGDPWIAYEWLGEVVLGAVNRAGGVLALDFLLIAVAAAIMISLYSLATLRSGNSKAGFVAATILCPLAFGSFTLRPQMFGYLFLVLTFIILVKFRKGTRWPIWLLPVIFLAWVNTHGSFIIGIGLIVLYLCAGLYSFQLGGVRGEAWTRKQRMQIEASLALSLAVLPITPYGAQLAVYPFDMAFSQPLNVASIMEWQPISFNLPGAKIFLGLVVLAVLLELLFRFTWRVEELALAMGGAAAFCLHMRFVMLFVPFFAPFFATVLARWIPPYQRKIDKYALNAILMALVVGLMIHYRPTEKSLMESVNKPFPIGAVQYLKNNPVPGKLYNTYGFGGYLVFSGVPTFIDGRADLFERGGVFDDYMRISVLKPAALEILRNYHVSACMLQHDEALATVLQASPNWKRVYADNTAALFVRTDIAEAAAHR